MDLNIDNERRLFLDIYFYTMRDDIGDLENSIYNSRDGLESRIIAKDLLYKFENYLRANGQKGINLKARLLETGHYTRPFRWFIKKQFREFIENESKRNHTTPQRNP